MYAFPRRKNVRRRSTPRAALFDPSGDARCVGWWRADQNVVVDPQWSLVSNWNSLLPNAKTLAPLSGDLPQYIESLSNGFPAVLWQLGSARFYGSTLFVGGETGATLTVALRTLYFNTDTWLYYLAGASTASLGIGARANRWAIYANNTYYISGMYAPGDVPGIVSYRVCPSDAANPNMWHRLTVNGSPAISVVNAGSPFTPTSATGLMIADSAQHPQAVHEIMLHNSVLSDAEISEMHTVLLAQYGGT